MHITAFSRNAHFHGMPLPWNFSNWLLTKFSNTLEASPDFQTACRHSRHHQETPANGGMYTSQLIEKENELASMPLARLNRQYTSAKDMIPPSS